MKDGLNSLIRTYSDYLKRKYQRKIFRVGLSTGIPCPHRIQHGGCIFCHQETFTGEYQTRGLTVAQQLEEAIPRILDTCGDVGLIAYFQDETSTAGSLDFLREQYQAALAHPEILGLIVSTRPDYIEQPVIDLLKSLPVPVTVEIGLQTIHNASLQFLNRGHDFAQADEAIRRCGENGLETGVHLIIGIPGESREDIKDTIRYVSGNPCISQVKFHNLVAYKNTPLAKMVRNSNLNILDIDQYIEILGDILPLLRSDIVITRLFTSNIRRSQIALGNYSGSKPEWLNRLQLYLLANNIHQGKNIL